ncbi:hypothetical protein CDL15_Pgr020459 [Punica granatum]|uniref:DSBA-like thioredoxin domain-containing protein n=1 Tax=Punica granatum TaxID=22663 RepID=A0A218VX98_PUNGR|nr:hypothetical protein CDL15_Pgr020459 [Punica granatum]
MAESVSQNVGKKLIQIDISSDTVCPWCFVGKKNLDKAMAIAKNQYDFETKWRPFFLNPSVPKEGINKREFYRSKFGPQSEKMEARMSEVFRGLGLEYSLNGLIGNTLDSHRLIFYAGQKAPEMQHNLVEELCLGYFTQGKSIGDRRFCCYCSRNAESSFWKLEGAAEFLEDPNNGLQEVQEELAKYSSRISGVPHYLIDGKYELSGAQSPEVFLGAFEAAAKGK